MSKERILSEAAFRPESATYHVTSLAIALTCTIVGIPALLFAVPIASWYWKKYYANLRVVLTTRDLKVHRGILNKEEKCIPLEKITDLAVFQGPIMRHFGVRGIKVETAGQSTGAGALVRVIGIEDVDTFRDLVLTQRDRITDRDDAPAAATIAATGAQVPTSANGAMVETLSDIRDTLRRIEGHLSKQ